jgi:hypothetical protein
MKKLILTLALAAVTTFTYAQGTIQFLNTGPTRFNVNGARPLSASAGGPVGGTYNFGVFVGTTAASLSAVNIGAVGTNTSTGGLMSGPSPNAFQLPGFDANTTVFIQIRGWESRFGQDYNQAVAAGSLHGSSATLPFLLGPASGPGAVIWAADVADLTKLQAINLVPEPSTIALAVLGLGSLLLFRRRK